MPMWATALSPLEDGWLLPPYISRRASALLNQREPCFDCFSWCPFQLGSPSWHEERNMVPAGVSSAGLPLLQAPWVPAQQSQGGSRQETRRTPVWGHTHVRSTHYPLPWIALVSDKWGKTILNPFWNDNPFIPPGGSRAVLLEILPTKVVFVNSPGADPH